MKTLVLAWSAGLLGLKRAERKEVTGALSQGPMEPLLQSDGIDLATLNGGAGADTARRRCRANGCTLPVNG